MAKRKKQAKLFSDLKLSRNANGQFTIGGRFASKRQVGSWKAARKRRGLPVPSDPPIPRTAKLVRSRAAIKAAETRRAQSIGAKFVEERVTKVAKFRQRIWELTDFTVQSVKAVIDRELSGNSLRALIFGAALGVDEDDNDVTIGTISFNARDEDTPELIVDDMNSKISAYLIASVNKFFLTLSFGR